MASATDYTLLNNRNLKVLANTELPLEPFKLFFVENYIWCIAYRRQKDSSRICVFNENCELVREIRHNEISNATSLTAVTNSRNILISCYADQGLHQLSYNGETYLCHITKSGSFSDLVYYAECMYALEYKICKVMIFKRNTETWREFNEINLPAVEGNACDRLLVSHQQIYVSMFKSNAVYIYNLQGQLQHEYKQHGNLDPGQFNGPSLCDIDSAKNVVVADCYNNRLQVLKHPDKWIVIPLPKDMRIPADIVSRDNHLWIIYQEPINTLKMFYIT